MKIETVVEPSEHIFEIQQRYIKLIGDILPTSHIEAVGGMAVPMIGRSELAKTLREIQRKSKHWVLIIAALQIMHHSSSCR